MAITTAADWKVYDDEIQAAYAERVAQNLDVLVGRSNGAIIVDDAAAPGRYNKASFFKLPSGAVTRRIATGTGSTSAVTPTTVSQGENVRVRLSRKFLFDITWDSLRVTGITPDTFSLFLGQQIADLVLQKQLNDALLACVASVNKTATTNDITGATVKTLSRAALYGAMSKFGDRQNDIVAWVGHSKPYGDLFAEANAPAAGASDILTQVAIFGAQAPTFNRPFLMTDSASLIQDVTVDKYYTLGLTAGAIQISLDQMLAAPVVETVTGLENLVLRVQGERDWFLGIKGYAYDATNGGPNPLDAALGTVTNWDLAASSIKDTAGVVVKTT
jgi:hypothetical protein